MTPRRHDHDDYVRPMGAVPLETQLAGTMFGDLGAMPAGSQPVETSELAADSLGTERLAKLRRQVLQMYALAGDRGLTADEVTASFDTDNHNSYAPRVTELHGMGYLTRLDGKHGAESLRRETRQGGTAFVLTISRQGRAFLDRDTLTRRSA
jgi:hypothetical protein